MNRSHTPANDSASASGRITWKYVARLFALFVVTLAAGIYLSFAPMVNYEFFTQKVLFRPLKCTRYDDAVLGSRGREVTFKNSAGTTLHGLYFPARNEGTKTILLHHGMANNLNVHAAGCQTLADSLAAPVFAYDYSGFGRSGGTPSVGGLPDDARAAHEFLVNEMHIAPESIVHYGASLGTGPAVAVAAERPCAGLILFAPYTSIKNAARDVFPFLRYYPDFLVVNGDMESLDNIKKVRCPVLIMHGESDATIPVHHGDDMYAAANEPKEYLRVKDGHHDGVVGFDARIAHFMASLK